MSAPRLPEVGEFVRGVGRLHSIEAVPPPPQPPPTTDFVFATEYATVEVRLNGQTLASPFGTLTDFYGYGTGVESAKELASGYMTTNRITATSDIEVVVVKTVEFRRARPRDRESFYAREYLDFEWLSIGAKREVPEDSKEVVWSSRAAANEGGAA